MQSWKTLDCFEFGSTIECVSELNGRGYRVSDWISDVSERFVVDTKRYPVDLYKVRVGDIISTNPVELLDFYDALKSEGFNLVTLDNALMCRFMYDEQEKGEWMRFATPLDSMVDSDGVPHLPKLGSALNKYYIETYWSYPKAIFHSHNEFVVSR